MLSVKIFMFFTRFSNKVNCLQGVFRRVIRVCVRISHKVLCISILNVQSQSVYVVINIYPFAVWRHRNVFNIFTIFQRFFSIFFCRITKTFPRTTRKLYTRIDDLFKFLFVIVLFFYLTILYHVVGKTKERRR